MRKTTVKSTATAVAVAMVLAGCTASQQRVATGGALGAAAGALIGGLIIADAIERDRARASALAAVRSGGTNVANFRNSRGDRVTVRSRVVRTSGEPGQRVRVVERTVIRNGQTAGTETLEGREVRLANGQTQWTGLE